MTNILRGHVDTMTLLTKREWRRLRMEPSRVVGILLQPLLFLLVFGVGFHSSFHLTDSLVRYVDFFYPGILGLVVLFSSIYATLTLVDDKKCGLFRLALIGPGGVSGAVMGKVIATFTLGLAQSCLFLLLAIPLGIKGSVAIMVTTLVLLSQGALVFATIGVCFAWLSPSPSAFHALMSIVLIPMWLLSGAMFPLDEGALATLAIFNPMAYLVTGLRISLLQLPGSLFACMAGLAISFFVALFLLVMAVSRKPIE